MTLKKKMIPNTPLCYDSITVVNRKPRHGVGVWGNRRVVAGVRVDEGLYLAFKPIAKRVFGSTCRAVEAFMAAVVACNNNAVNFGNSVEINEVIIERNLRARRSLVVGNFFDGLLWKTVDAPFNENGHGVGCKCVVCSKGVRNV